MRSREFIMKDAYSFDLSKEDAEFSYYKMFAAYLRTFDRLGLRAIPMRADTGPIGGDLSHEFIILADTGESEVFCHKKFMDFDIPEADVDFRDLDKMKQIFEEWTRLYAATSEMHDEAAFNAIDDADKVSARGIEVGHIFYFGTKYSAAMGANVMGPDGREHPVHMGSYGIGPTRLVPAIIEASHDENGIIWPKSVAPFEVGIINMKAGDEACDAACEKIYAELMKAGFDVVLDDRDERAGGKFATADLIGIPEQIVVGPRGLKTGEVELKNRKSGERVSLTIEAALNKLIAEK
jgi:prolyl-tRNA synthetase